MMISEKINNKMMMWVKNFLIFLVVFGLINISAAAQTVFWADEAENGTLIGTAEIVEGCANASGGKFVKLASVEGNALAFSNIEIPTTGTYVLKFHYFYLGQPLLEIWVNNDSIGIEEFPGSGWCYNSQSGSYAMAINLIAGTNTIEFRSTIIKAAPLLDKFEIYNAGPVNVSVSASVPRITPGKELQLIVETATEIPGKESVEIEISGISENDFSLTPQPVTIESGTKRAIATFVYTNPNPKSTETVVIKLKNPSPGLLTDPQDSVEIAISSLPSNYYISSSSGNDSNDGLSANTPWKTLNKVQSFSFIPGDSILFKCGDTFFGQLKFQGSGMKASPIVISNYGEGSFPHFDGANAEGGACEAAIVIENQEYIEIEKLEISNDRKVSKPGVNDYDANGIMVLNTGDKIMHHLVFRKLNIHDVYPISLNGVDFNAIKVTGILLKSLANNEPGKEKNIQDVLVEDCYFTHTARLGVFSQHGGGASGIGNDSINRNMNLVFRNNHFFELGGSGIVPGRSFNCLVENNIFEYCGSNVDPRMVNRGSGAWFWNCRNVVAQYNKSLHIRGSGDSYGMHIDFGNRNVIFQYNYSEDSEGGFVEILGQNVNSVYRFNVSVNDGIRNIHGNSLWISTYAGNNIKIPSDSNYIYNNTIYVDADITPDILINGENTFVYNNIFYATGNAVIGKEVTVEMFNGASFLMANNLFYGNVTVPFSNYDTHPLFGNPLFKEPGALYSEGYKLLQGSKALGAGTTFPEPKFPMAGKGIFKDVKLVPETDLFGNPINIENETPHIGAYNGSALLADYLLKNRNNLPLKIYPNPVISNLQIELKKPENAIDRISIIDNLGRTIFQTHTPDFKNGSTTMNISYLNAGIYYLSISTKSTHEIQSFVKL